MAYWTKARRFLVLDEADSQFTATPVGGPIFLMTPFAEPGGLLRGPAGADSSVTATFDPKANSLLLLGSASRELLEARPRLAGLGGRIPDPTIASAPAWDRFEITHFGLQDPRGMTVDPRTGSLFILDGLGPQIVRITPRPSRAREGARALRDGQITHLDLDPAQISEPRGIAFNPANGHLYVADRARRRIVELSAEADVLVSFEIPATGLAEPRSLVFAPSGDPTDDPSNLSLYVADGGPRDGAGPEQARGGIVELAFPVAARTAALINPFNASLIRTIDTSRFSPPSPDPMGLAYDPVSNRLVMSDSEVEEIPTLYAGVNVWELSLAGAILRTSHTRAFSNEPAGVALNPAGRVWYFSDDDVLKVWVVSLGADGLFHTADDKVTSFSTAAFGDIDPEGVSYDPVSKHMFLVSGLGTEIYELSAGANARFDGVPPAGDDLLVRHFDTASMGLPDPETVEVNPDSRTLYITSRDAHKIVETTFSGTIVREIDTTSVPGNRPSGLAYAPASDNPSIMHLYISDRGADNDGSPGENDGKIFEITLPTTGTSPAGSGGASTGTDLRVASSSDDAEESATGSMSLSSSDLELVFDGNAQKVGIRFKGLALPRGATIGSAFIQFTAKEAQADATSLRLQGQASDSAPTFTSSSSNVSSRARTAATVTWSPAPWTAAGEAGSAQKTPDLSAIVQEIVNRPGWASGNSLAFIVTGTGHRTAWSFDGSAGTAARLIVQLAPANKLPSASAGPDQIVTLPASAALNGTVSDDGLPNPPGRLTTLWSTVSGPGTVSFGDAGAVDTTASFSAAGTYVLSLMASDGTLSASDQVTIAVDSSTLGAAGSSVRIAAGSDDAEESASGSMNLTSSDLELVFDGNIQMVSLRFKGLAIPRGAAITAASIQFTADETQSETTRLSIQGQSADNPPAFTATSHNISSRPRTVAAAAWSPAAWTTIGEAGPAQRTPDLSAIVQEIVNRPGWASGNAMAFMVTGTGHRTAVAFEGGAARAPQLRITFAATAAPNVAPAVSAGPDKTAGWPAAATLDGTVSDDGLPTPGSVSAAWTLISGPGTAAFGEPASPSTTASFSAPGTYVLRLTADDGELLASDDVTVTADAAQPSSFAFEIRIGARSDDAEEGASGSVNLASSDLELIHDSTDQKVGLRFSAVAVPPGATILSAYIQFQADEAQSAPTVLALQGQLADSAPAFAAAANNISSRPRTAASVPWTPAAWTVVGETVAAQRTPDLSALVQEIVNRPGWASGNALVFIVTGTGHRTAVAFDGVPAGAPLLHVDYQ